MSPQLLVLGKKYLVSVQDGTRSYLLRGARLIETNENSVTFELAGGRQQLYGWRAIIRIEVEEASTADRYVERDR